MLKYRMNQNWLDSLHDILWNTETAMAHNYLQKKKPCLSMIFLINLLWFDNMRVHYVSRQTSVSVSTQWPTDWTCTYQYSTSIVFPSTWHLLELHQRITRVANRVEWDRLQQILELDYHWGIFRVSNGLHIEHLEINLKNFIVLYSSFLSF
jgi:hypothetical protein